MVLGSRDDFLKVTLESEHHFPAPRLQLQQGNPEVRRETGSPKWVLDLPLSGGTRPETEPPQQAPRVLVRLGSQGSMMSALIQAEVGTTFVVYLLGDGR